MSKHHQTHAFSLCGFIAALLVLLLQPAIAEQPPLKTNGTLVDLVSKYVRDPASVASLFGTYVVLECEKPASMSGSRDRMSRCSFVAFGLPSPNMPPRLVEVEAEFKSRVAWDKFDSAPIIVRGKLKEKNSTRLLLLDAIVVSRR